jgi:uncharacterized membrane protein YccC
MKLPRLSIAGSLIWLGLCGAVGTLVAYFSSMSFWASFAIAAVALITNSVIAEVEDNAPGGFNNPESKTK